MSYEEKAVVFGCGDEQLVGIVTVPQVTPARVGVVVIVGGPQYRAGSHRQFVLLARALATEGIACMRFDYRGMGDSGGETRPFDDVDDDVGAAIERFRTEVPVIERVVLWALCDGASAACLHAPSNPRVAGLVLLNPWVRTAAGAARTSLEKYYFRRLFDKAFWRKLLQGNVAVRQGLGDVLRALRLSKGGGSERQTAATVDLPARMAAGLAAAARPTLFLLSGRDYVADEFDLVAREGEAWREIMKRSVVERFPEADHTFSTRTWRDAVAARTVSWIKELETP